MPVFTGGDVGIERSRRVVTKAGSEIVLSANDYADWASSHHTVFLDVEATRFGSAVKDSPPVDKLNQNMLALGYVYRF